MFARTVVQSIGKREEKKRRIAWPAVLLGDLRGGVVGGRSKQVELAQII